MVCLMQLPLTITGEDFVQWEILKEGEEISEDVMSPHPVVASPFSSDDNITIQQWRLQ